MDLANVDKLAKDNRGIKHLILRKDLFEKTMDVRGLKTKDSNEAVSPFPQSGRDHKRFGLTREKTFLVNLKSFAQGRKTNLLNNEKNKGRIRQERAIRSLENVLYRYIGDYGYRFIHKLPHFVTTLNPRKNRSTDMKPSNV